jgi:hypothetical protein
VTGSHARPPGPAALAAVIAGVVACGAPQQPRSDGDRAVENRSSVTDTRSALEKRRDAACEQLGPKLTACAVEDARADLAAGKVDKAQFDRDTAPEIQRKNTEEFVTACKGASYSSRQVRVLEVCFREEARCAPLLECLGHLNDTGANR